MDKNGTFDAKAIRGFVRETLAHHGLLPAKGQAESPADIPHRRFTFEVDGTQARFVGHSEGEGPLTAIPSEPGEPEETLNSRHRRELLPRKLGRKG